MINLKVQDFGLVHAIYPMGTVKFGMSGLRQAKVPKICPHCLQPGNTQQHFGPFVVGMWRLTIPISTHRECSQGFRKRNISGSTRVWEEGGNICFKFENPVYAMLFSRINFSILNDSRNRPLTSIYANELRDLRKKQEARKKKIGTCPRCNNDLYADLEGCPSCGLSRRETWTRMMPSEVKTIPIKIDSESIIECPKCGIKMLKEANLKSCGHCGTILPI
jgi:hypothetical protein